MQPRKFRILSAIMAGVLALAVMAIAVSSGTSPSATHAALAVRNESFLPVNLDDCPILLTGYPPGGCAAQLQTDLNTSGSANLSVDGVFGPATKNAVIAFQQKHDVVPADGIVGLQTKAALDIASGNAVATPTPGDPAPNSAPATSGGQSTTIATSPDYKIVRYIHSFSIHDCAGNFVINGVPGGLTACTLIDATSNPTPNADIASADASWTKFQGSKEYRSIVHLPPYEITCDAAGNLVSPPEALSPPGISAGFTPIRLWVHTFHVAGEKYQDQSGIWYDVNPRVDIVTPSTARIIYRVAARAGTAENGGNPGVSGYSLPFIWTLVQEQLSCGKAPAALVTYSQMPSTMIYKDGARVLADIQTSDLGEFVKEGGIGNPIPGKGNLYIPCRAFGMDQLSGVAITPDCNAAASPEPSWAAFPPA